MQTMLFDPDELENKAETKKDDPGTTERPLESMQELLRHKYGDTQDMPVKKVKHRRGCSKR